MMDHEVAHSDHMKLRVDDIAEKLSVTRRTVYSMIEREGWAKEEGARGRVWYHVPVSFIDQYIRSAQEDQNRSVKTLHTVSQAINTPSQESPQPSTPLLSDDILKSYVALGDKVLSLSEDMVNTKVQLELKTKEVEQKTNEIAVLNNERASYNTSLQKYRDTKKELEDYQEKLSQAQKELQAKDDEINALKAQLETTQAEAAKKPRWKLW